jgi:hypothetical protein
VLKTKSLKFFEHYKSWNETGLMIGLLMDRGGSSLKQLKAEVPQ